MKTTKLVNIIFIAVFALVITAVPVATVLLPRAGVSEFENRALAKFPVLERSAVFSGEYFENVDKWLEDHLVGRDAMLTAYVALEKDVLKKPVVNGIYDTGERLLPFLNYYPADAEELESETSAMVTEITALSDYCASLGAEFYYAGIKCQMSAFREEYPDYLYNRADEFIYKEENFAGALRAAGVNYIDVTGAFGENYKDYYLRTDHHYTYEGAYLAYRAIIGAVNGGGLGVPELERDDLAIRELPNPFLGSRGRVLYNLCDYGEKISVGEQKNPVAFTRYDNGEKVWSGLYSIPADETAYVDFTVYMGGDKGETVFNTGRSELPDAVFFGDSYTNPVETMLYTSFNKLYVLDLRHYDKMTLYEYIAEKRPSAVIELRDDGICVETGGNGTFR